MSDPTRTLRATPVLLLVLLLVPARGVRADPVISEFLAANTTTIVDHDGASSDWIEIFNPDPQPASLAGWYLTDTATDKKKWAFPDVTVAAGGYLLVWASNQNRRDPAKPLHTNFVLNAAGDYLALLQPDGTTVATEFAPAFPAQWENISYGVTQPAAATEPAVRGHFRTPTPGARNGGAAALFLPERAVFSRASGPFLGPITVTLSGAAAGQQIRYVVALSLIHI